MKQKSKDLIKKWCVSSQISSRPTKAAKGMSFTNERRARKTNNSMFYAGFYNSKYKTTDECRTLSVCGTLDKLRVSTARKLSMRRFIQKRSVLKYNQLM